MHIKELEWQDTLAIRQKVLWPNKNQEFCRVTGDEDASHYGVLIDQKIVSVASVYPDITTPNKQTARLRKFATLAPYQNQGIGSFVLRHIIDVLKTDGVAIFWCDARESAIEFYQRFGFKVEGERFYKSDIPYFKMQMSIS